MANYRSPGVYIEEKYAFPNSVVEVETGIPAFIGYTFKAERNGKSLIRIPTRIDSFGDYLEYFGGAFQPKFEAVQPAELSKQKTFKLGSKNLLLKHISKKEAYFFNSIKLFYANGGSTCIILSIGTYGTTGEVNIKSSDFMATKNLPVGPLELLKTEQQSTLIVMPDVVALGKKAYPIYQKVLAHCAETQCRFGIFDLKKHDDGNEQTPLQLLKEFRESIGKNFLNYGAAYYPWINTSLVNSSEMTFENIVELEKLLEPDVQEILNNYKKEYAALNKDKTDEIAKLRKATHLKLRFSSPCYRALIKQATILANQMPPSAAMAGIYTKVDNTRGVWKAPANCSLDSVSSPMVKISNKLQGEFNLDAFTGKSVNVIRPFQGLGTLVWGGRTLDGNSADWRYINVRRTLIMIEQSIKSATRAYVFEPNDSNTWITVKAMISNFLTNLWKLGALAGATPEQAYDVQIGLGSTMTPTDILEGKMLISIKVAVVKPAEFIIITFQQQLQQS